jgi:hypothetical protein
MIEDNAVGNFVMGIVVVAMILAIGLLILSEFKDSVGDDIAATSVVNESVTWTNATKDALTYSGFSLSCSAVYNDTANTVLITSVTGVTYTCDTGGITITDEDGSTNTDVYVNYNYKTGNAAYNATGTNITKLATIPTWIGILITVILAFIVLGYFYSRNN